LNSYIFVVAAVVSIFSVYFVFKYLLKEVKQEKVTFEKTQKRFLIGMFLSKIVPLILIIFGIIKMSYKELNQLYIPGILILIAMVIGLILIEKIKKDNKNDSKNVYKLFNYFYKTTHVNFTAHVVSFFIFNDYLNMLVRYKHFTSSLKDVIISFGMKRRFGGVLYVSKNSFKTYWS